MKRTDRTLHFLRWLQHAHFPNHRVVDKLLSTSVAERVLERGMQFAEFIGAQRSRASFEEVEKFCLFIGHPRSGHSLVGSLLDAHPNMVIAHEWDSLRQVKRAISKDRLFYGLLARSRWFKSRGAEWTGYKYGVPSQYKGEFTSLQVIGDKKGGGSTTQLRQDPDLLERLHRIVEIPIHVIHVKRHPLDNISTKHRKDEPTLDRAIDNYFRNCRTVKTVKERVCDKSWVNWIDVFQEDFVYETEASLRRICGFLGVDVTEDYLSDCAEVVFDRPSRSRTKVAYRGEHLDRIRTEMSQYPSLERYSLERREESR